MRFGIVILALCSLNLYGQNEEPRTKPFALNLGLQNKYSLVKHTDSFVPQVALDYRFLRSRLRVGVTYSYTPETKEKTVSGSVNFKVFEFGRRR